MTKLGLIGLGLVGKALAGRLIRAGYPLSGFDIDRECRDAFVLIGGTTAANALAVASQVDVCLLSLPNGPIAADVLAEIEPALHGKLVIDTTTAAPDISLANGSRLRQASATYLDATIVGSSKQVASGDTIMLVGGEEAAFQRATPVLNCIAKRSFYLGPCGSGARMKLVVNLVLGLNRAVLAEGLSFAKACGIDPSEALEVLQASAAYSKVMDTKGRKMVDGDFTAEAKLAQHHKDVRLILAEAARTQAIVPLSRLHDELLSLAESRGLAEMDNSAIVDVFAVRPSATR